MSVELDFPIRIIQSFLVFTRLSAFIFSGPVFMMNQFSARWKTGFIVCITIVIMPVLPDAWDASQFEQITTFRLVMLILGEFILGLTISAIVRLLMEVLVIGGYLIDRDIGFAMTQMFDPSQGGNRTIISLIFIQTFSLLFLVHNGHHDFIRLAVASFETVKPGAFVIDQALVNGMIGLGSNMFVSGFRLALPIFTIVMTINLSMALITKFGQEFQVMMLSFPIRMGLGIFIIISMIPVYFVFARDLISTILDTVFRLIAG